MKIRQWDVGVIVLMAVAEHVLLVVPVVAKVDVEEHVHIVAKIHAKDIAKEVAEEDVLVCLIIKALYSN